MFKKDEVICVRITHRRPARECPEISAEGAI